MCSSEQTPSPPTTPSPPAPPPVFVSFLGKRKRSSLAKLVLIVKNGSNQERNLTEVFPTPSPPTTTPTSSPPKTPVSRQNKKQKSRFSGHPDFLNFDLVGDTKLKDLLRNQNADLMERDCPVELKGKKCFIRRPTVLLTSIIKQILIVFHELHFKLKRRFDGDLGDLNVYGLCGEKDSNGGLGLVNKVILLSDPSANSRDDSSSAMKQDRKRLRKVIVNLLAVKQSSQTNQSNRTPKVYLAQPFRRVLALLDKFVRSGSEGDITYLINFHAFRPWSDNILKLSGMYAMFKSDIGLLTHKPVLQWRKLIPPTGLLKRFLMDTRTRLPSGTKPEDVSDSRDPTSSTKYVDRSISLWKFVRDVFSHSLEKHHDVFRLRLCTGQTNRPPCLEHCEALQILLMEMFGDEVSFLLQYKL